MPTQHRAAWQHGLIVGSALGVALFSLHSGGGYDAYKVFLTNQLQTVPPWAHLFLKPFAQLRWPFSYALMSGMTWLVVAYSAFYVAENPMWWLVTLSLPGLWEIWSGQIEGLMLLGLIVVWAVWQQRLPVAWLGVGWALLLTKPWLGWETAILSGIWLFRRNGAKGGGQALALMALVIGWTFLWWPDWIYTWLLPFLAQNFQRFAPFPQRHIAEGVFPALPVGALWPWGLLSWLLLAAKRPSWGDIEARPLPWIRLVFAASLLSVPYLRFYHVLPLMALVSNRKVLLGSFLGGWAIVARALLMGSPWGQWAWVLPVFIFLSDWSSEKRLVI